MAKRRMHREPVVQPLDQSYRLIPLTRGLVAKVSPAKFDWASQWNWYALRTRNGFYAARDVDLPAPRTFLLHREIIGARSPHVDHKNGDTLDCRDENLRECTEAQNHANHKIQSNNTSGHSGIDFNKRRQKWRARIKVNGRERNLGLFATKELAIEARLAAERIHFGEFAFSARQQELLTSSQH